MKDNLLISLSKQFAIDIIGLCKIIKKSRDSCGLYNQLIRSGTSIGANIHEANYASSKADFINKLQIALKECYETEYWIGVFKESDIMNDSEFNDIASKCWKIRKLLISSLNTAKENLKTH